MEIFIIKQKSVCFIYKKMELHEVYMRKYVATKYVATKIYYMAERHALRKHVLPYSEWNL